ncbi:hypothetical protein GIB67_010309 [Kingdonia uniflora]|uniref:Uncharacterized protein n=1 Tax=Kingdonia uniflora TaxID=39325 RepID=A0A7J7LD53_9MAGN|nr:hypothetical protein GIB67_010309 [Kingdonia uniflora]
MAFSWSTLWLAVVLANITLLSGVTLSYHKNLAHWSFKLLKYLEYLFTYLGLHALQDFGCEKCVFSQRHFPGEFSLPYMGVSETSILSWFNFFVSRNKLRFEDRKTTTQKLQHDIFRDIDDSSAPSKSFGNPGAAGIVSATGTGKGRF